MDGLNQVNVTHDDIAAYAEGIAEPEVVRRVTAAALLDSRVRGHLELLFSLDEAQGCGESAAATASGTGSTPVASPSDAEEIVRLRQLVQDVFTRVKAQTVPPTNETAIFPEDASALPSPILTALQDQASRLLHNGRGGGLWCITAEAAQAFLRAGPEAHALVVGRQVLTLPCLSPAMAASAGASAELQVRRQTVATADGVRIEFQQLPGYTLNRLRVLVDASELAAHGLSVRSYNVAYITLEENRGWVGDEMADRHILVIALNEIGRGYADFIVGGRRAETGDGMPSPEGPYALVSATLSRLSRI